MKLSTVAAVGALLVGSWAAVAEETRVAVAEVKHEMQMPAPVPARVKPRETPKRVQKKISRPVERDAAQDWPQLG